MQDHHKLRTQHPGLRTEVRVGLDGHVDLFLNYLAAERGLAANTLAAYSRDLAAFVNHVARGRVETKAQIHAHDVVKFLEALQQRGLSARSRARMFAALRGFCAFLVREEVLAADPTRDIRLPRLG